MAKKLLPQDGICPVATTMDLLSSKWKVLIMRDLLQGTKRYSELQRSVAGISQKMLTQCLKEMEQDGLVIRKAYPEVPPRVEYHLSTLGSSMCPIIDAMRDWGNKYLQEHPERRHNK